jgi:hypothetical protein
MLIKMWMIHHGKLKPNLVNDCDHGYHIAKLESKSIDYIVPHIVDIKGANYNLHWNVNESVSNGGVNYSLAILNLHVI